jgi:hypothetical protein
MAAAEANRDTPPVAAAAPAHSVATGMVEVVAAAARAFNRVERAALAARTQMGGTVRPETSPPVVVAAAAGPRATIPTRA